MQIKDDDTLEMKVSDFQKMMADTFIVGVENGDIKGTLQAEMIANLIAVESVKGMIAKSLERKINANKH